MYNLLNLSQKKGDGTTIDDSEDLDLVIPMYSLEEYGSNYSETTGNYGFIQKMKQQILMQMLQTPIMLHPSCIRLNY